MINPLSANGHDQGWVIIIALQETRKLFGDRASNYNLFKDFISWKKLKSKEATSLLCYDSCGSQTLSTRCGWGIINITIIKWWLICLCYAFFFCCGGGWFNWLTHFSFILRTRQGIKEWIVFVSITNARHILLCKIHGQYVCMYIPGSSLGLTHILISAQAI